MNNLHYLTLVTGVCNIEQFNNTISGGGSCSLLLLSLNIRSFYKHRDELLAILSAMNVQPDVLVLTETWLNVADVDYANIDG